MSMKFEYLPSDRPRRTKENKERNVRDPRRTKEISFLKNADISIFLTCRVKIILTSLSILINDKGNLAFIHEFYKYEKKPVNWLFQVCAFTAFPSCLLYILLLSHFIFVPPF